MSQRELRQMLKNGNVRTAGKPRATGEHDNQSAFFDLLRLNEPQHPDLKRIFAIPNAAKRSPRVIAEMKAEGLKAGVPDIFIPIGRHGYFGAWIENKFGGNKMSAAQSEYREFLLKNNYAFKICYTALDQIEFLEWYLGIELTK